MIIQFFFQRMVSIYVLLFYVLHPYQNVSYSTELFKVAKHKSNKWQKEDNDLEIDLWHLRPCYINLDRIKKLVKDRPLRELRVCTLPVCESCLDDKMTKKLFSTNGQRATHPLKVVHSDVCRPLPLNVQVTGAYEYCATFINDYSWYATTYLMTTKSKTFRKFNDFRVEAEKNLGKIL